MSDRTFMISDRVRVRIDNKHTSMFGLTNQEFTVSKSNKETGRTKLAGFWDFWFPAEWFELLPETPEENKTMSDGFVPPPEFGVGCKVIWTGGGTPVYEVRANEHYTVVNTKSSSDGGRTMFQIEKTTGDPIGQGYWWTWISTNWTVATPAKPPKSKIDFLAINKELSGR